MKASLQKLQPRDLNYDDYKQLQNNAFRKEFLSDLLDLILEENEEGLSNFINLSKNLENAKSNRKTNEEITLKKMKGTSFRINLKPITTKKSIQNNVTTVLTVTVLV